MIEYYINIFCNDLGSLSSYFHAEREQALQDIVDCTRKQCVRRYLYLHTLYFSSGNVRIVNLSAEAAFVLTGERHD